MTNDTADLALLYPFLYGGSPDDAQGEAHDDLVASTRAKLEESRALCANVLTLHREALVNCAIATARALRAGGRMLTFGNGGSATDATEVAARFGERFRAVALTDDVATSTALANDIGFERGLARHLQTMARPRDVALGLSTSGDSPNLVEAFAVARARGVLTIGFAGYDGGRFSEPGVVEHLFVVPSASVHRIQEAQAALYDVLCQLTGHAYEEEQWR